MTPPLTNRDVPDPVRSHWRVGSRDAADLESLRIYSAHGTHIGTCSAPELALAAVGGHNRDVRDRRVMLDPGPPPLPALENAPALLLLCLGPCAGEFYLDLELGDALTCPNDADHPVAVYTLAGARGVDT